MKKLTTKDIQSWEPCYDPIQFIPESWEGTILDILDLSGPSFQDKLWVILRVELVSEKLMRLFAVWCARQVQHLMKDQRSIIALDVADRFANGNATKDELGAARDAAGDAAWDAARDAAGDAARAAARAAAWDAAWGAAWDAAWDAAGDAAGGAAWDAARDAAWGAAWDAAGDAQEKKLREMIIAGIETGDVK